LRGCRTHFLLKLSDELPLVIGHVEIDLALGRSILAESILVAGLRRFLGLVLVIRLGNKIIDSAQRRAAESTPSGTFAIASGQCPDCCAACRTTDDSLARLRRFTAATAAEFHLFPRRFFSQNFSLIRAECGNLCRDRSGTLGDRCADGVNPDGRHDLIDERPLPLTLGL